MEIIRNSYFVELIMMIQTCPYADCFGLIIKRLHYFSEMGLKYPFAFHY